MFRLSALDDRSPSGPVTPAEMQADVEWIAAAMGVTITWTPGRYDARAWRMKNGRHAIRVAPVKTPKTYYSALHELGHIQGSRAKHRLEEEARAWVWAFENAKFPPTPGVRKMVARCLSGYFEWACQNQHRKRPPRIPAPDSAFWRLSRITKDQRELGMRFGSIIPLRIAKKSRP